MTPCDLEKIKERWRQAWPSKNPADFDPAICGYQNVPADLTSLIAEVEALRKALGGLLHACQDADEQGELYHSINGELMDAAAIALGELKSK